MLYFCFYCFPKWETHYFSVACIVSYCNILLLLKMMQYLFVNWLHVLYLEMCALFRNIMKQVLTFQKPIHSMVHQFHSLIMEWKIW